MEKTQNRSLPKILITAYAVNPYKGSEDGTGWNMIAQIAKHNQVVAITRKNNQADIEKYLAEQNLPQAKNLTFAYFDLPYWMRFWKKGGRGALLYFYLWQLGIVFFILAKKIKCDLVHNLNFHNDWTPSFLWALGKPFVWGPIGHHPSIPKKYLIASAGKKAYYLDRLKWTTKKCFWWIDPFLKMTKFRAAKIITINSSVREVLNFPKEKEVRLPAVATQRPQLKNELTEKCKFNVISIGRFVSLKGFDVTIQAFGHFYHQQKVEDQSRLELTLIGKGPQLNQLKKLAKELKIETAVKFIDWMTRAELDEYFQQSSVFFFPSHEGAGMVVPEALSFGLPVLCYDNIGPGEFIDDTCGRKIPYSTPRESIVTFSEILSSLFQNPELQMQLAKGAQVHFEKYFTWERKGRIISEAYLDILFPERNDGKEEENQGAALPTPREELEFS